MRLALYEPDIPQNAGTLMRMAACLGHAIDVIEPCGFILGERRMRRAGLDYLDRARAANLPVMVGLSNRRGGRCGRSRGSFC